MDGIFNYNVHVDCTRVNNEAYLGFKDLFDLIQIMVTEYLGSVSSDNITIKKKYNSAWVITKAKVEIYKTPYWGDELKLKSYVTNMKSAKIDLETIIYDENDNIIALAKDELCPIDLSTRRIRRLKDIEFDVKAYEPKMAIGYNSMDLSKMVLFDKLTVKYCDIDFTNHANNVSYIRFISNSLGMEFFNNNIITSVDVHYINECKLDDELEIYKTEYSDNNIGLLIKKEDLNIFSISINYINK